MRHHFHIVIVFSVVALDGGDFAVDDHEFRVEGAEEGFVEVDGLEVEVWYFFWFGKLYRVSD